MTDRIDHRGAAELMLADADEWTAQAEEPTPEAGELSSLAYAAVHALLAIHDALTAANEERQREGQMEDAWQFRDWETVSRLQDEAEQREAAEPDPLDENDHRDRLDGNGLRLRRKSSGYWVWAGAEEVGGWTLDDIHRLQGPLTFAPDADGAPSVTPSVDDDPVDDAVSASEPKRRNLNAQDAEFSRLLAVSADPTAALRRAAMMEAVGVTDDQAKLFAQILAKGRLLPDDLQRLKAAVERTGDGRG